MIRLLPIAFVTVLLASAIHADATAQPGAADSKLRSAGRTLYVEHCASCHGGERPRRRTGGRQPADPAVRPHAPCTEEWRRVSIGTTPPRHRWQGSWRTRQRRDAGVGIGVQGGWGEQRGGHARTNRGDRGLPAVAPAAERRLIVSAQRHPPTFTDRWRVPFEVMIRYAAGPGTQGTMTVTSSDAGPAPEAPPARTRTK